MAKAELIAVVPHWTAHQLAPLSVDDLAPTAWGEPLPAEATRVAISLVTRMRTQVVRERLRASMRRAGEVRLPLPATCRCLHLHHHHPCRVDIHCCCPTNRARRAAVPAPLASGAHPTRANMTNRAARDYAGSSRCDRLDQARVIVLDAPDPRADRPASHLFRRKWDQAKGGRMLNPQSFT